MVKTDEEEEVNEEFLTTMFFLTMSHPSSVFLFLEVGVTELCLRVSAWPSRFASHFPNYSPTKKVLNQIIIQMKNIQKPGIFTFHFPKYSFEKQ